MHVSRGRSVNASTVPFHPSFRTGEVQDHDGLDDPSDPCDLFAQRVKKILVFARGRLKYRTCLTLRARGQIFGEVLLTGERVWPFLADLCSNGKAGSI